MGKKFWKILILSMAGAALALGCGDDDAADVDAGDTDTGDTDTVDTDTDDAGTDAGETAEPLIAISSPTSYAGVSGAVDVAVTISAELSPTLVELLVDGEVAASSSAAPFTLTWDTTAAADGVVTLSARATDAASETEVSEEIGVVVINGGYEVTFTEGATGTINIPEDYAGNTELIDKKYHWTTTAEGATRVIGVATFAPADGQAEWIMGFDMGSGYCPDSGTVLDSKAGQTVTAEPIVFDSSATYPASSQIFFHMRPANPMDHLGESMPFTLKAFAFPGLSDAGV